MKPGTILSIEASVTGGSLAVLKNGESFCSIENVARAETIINSIDSLLEETGITIADIDLICVSLGPGSFTGIRIGIATALGLNAANGTKCVGMTTTLAVASHEPQSDRFSVIPIGRGQFAIQQYQAGHIKPTANSRIRVLASEQLSDLIRTSPNDKFIFAGESSAASNERSKFEDEFEHVVVAGELMANLMCALAANGYGESVLEPVYARPENA